MRAALDRALPGSPRLADAIYADAAPNLDPTDTVWNSDVSLLVACLSPEHEERVRVYLGWAPARMAAEMARVRAEYPR